MTLISSMTSRRRGHATKKYARGLFFLGGGGGGGVRFSYRFSLLFSLCLSLLLGVYLIVLFWPCLFIETIRAFEKRHNQRRFSVLNFSSFCRHLKASGVLPVCDSGLILRTYKVTVLAHTKKSTLKIYSLLVI